MKNMMEDIQEKARLYMVTLHDKNSEDLRELFKVKRNLFITDKNQDSGVAITDLIKALVEPTGNIL